MPNVTHPELNNPPHYAALGIEPIHVIEELGLLPEFCLANAIKYLARKKGNRIEDLTKCRDYVRRMKGQRVLGLETLTQDRLDQVAKAWQLTNTEQIVLANLQEHIGREEIIEFYLTEAIREAEEQRQNAINAALDTPDKINAVRVKAGLSQDKLAKPAGVAQSIVSRIETGEQNPDTEGYFKVRKVLEELVSKEGV